MEPQKEREKFTPLVRWLLVLPVACLAAIGVLTVLSVGILLVWPWLWQMHSPRFVPGCTVVGFVWGGAMCAPTKRWWVRGSLLGLVLVWTFFLLRSYEERLRDMPQILIGGILGMLMVSLTLLCFPYSKVTE